MKLEAHCTILRPLLYGKFAIASYNRMFEDLDNVESFKFRGSYYNGNSTIIRSLVGPRIDLEEPIFPLSADERKLAFKVELKYPGGKLIEVKSPGGTALKMPEKQRRMIWRSIVFDEFSVFINTYLMSLQFAFPGIEFGEHKYYSGSRKHLESRKLSIPLGESISYLSDNGIYPISNLSPSEVYTWISSQNGVFSGRSDTPASRSVSYFSRLYTPQYREDELTDLVWALACLESLLVESGRSSVGQLKANLKALFPDPTVHEFLVKSVETTYQFRSKMIHGNRQIRSIFRGHELDTDARLDEEYDSMRFAVGIAYILIQMLISEKHQSFRFVVVRDK